MATLGSILLIAGVAGIILLLVVLTVRPKLFSRGVTVAVLVALFVIAATGLVILTAATGGRSLHTGG